MRVDEVFGISPSVREHSYVDRGELDELMATMLQRTTHIALRGPSKSGKSWLRQRALTDPITVQCRLRKPFTEVYVDALSQLEIKTTVKEAAQGVFRANLSATGSAGAALIAKVAGTLSAGGDFAHTVESQPIGHDVSDLRFVADLIKGSGRRLVIEDFHYMSTEDRRGFAFDLKALWDYGLFAVIIGVWSETNLLLDLNPDLTGRVTEIAIDWSGADLRQILLRGGRALALEFDQALTEKLTGMAYANAGLLQQLALLTLDDARVRGAGDGEGTLRVSGHDHADNAGLAYAEQLNPVYQQFAKRVAAGMRSRNNATGIYAHAMAVIMEAPDEQLISGLSARDIFEQASKRQPRIQYSNLMAVLEKFPSLQVDEDGRGLILGYSPATEDITVVDRQLLLYRRFSTVSWPWADLIGEAERAGGQLDMG